MELPASEIEFWREYYGIFTFPQDREDARTARLAYMINLSAQGKGYPRATVSDFLPNYLPTPEKTRAEKLRDAQAFRKHYQQLQEMKNGY